MASTRTNSMVASDLRIEFKTKEGIYKNLRDHRYSKPRGLPLLGKELSSTHITVVSVKDMQGLSEWLLFNSGRELYCYPFSATENPPDLAHPVDKHSYRTSYPLSHDVNLCTRSVDNLDLIVGFNGGPLQLINPITKSSIAIYNSDRHVDPTDVTCVRWVPGSETQFVSSHISGNLYVWSTEYQYKTSSLPTYSTHKELKDTTILVCKPRNKFPLIYRWTIGHGSIKAFAFSPDTAHIAVASQDGFLRVYDFHKMELYGRMRSYFGSLLCVCWSPDGKYVVSGGEDDLVSVWSFYEKRVVTRGEGHKSYVNAVSFDAHTSEANALHRSLPSDVDFYTSSTVELKSQRSSRFFEETESYRLGSVGQDGLLCLWELSGDNLTVVRRLHGRTRSRMVAKQTSSLQNEEEGEDEDEEEEESNDTESHEEKTSRRSTAESTGQPPIISNAQINNEEVDLGVNPEASLSNKSDDKEIKLKLKSKKKSTKECDDVELKSPVDGPENVSEGGIGTETSSVSSELSKNKKDKKHKKGKGSKPSVKSAVKRKVKNFISGYNVSSTPRRYVSAFESCYSDDIAPKMSEINVIEPLVCKKIWSERLTDLTFRDDCLLVATEDGYVQVWARPDYCPQPDSDMISGQAMIVTNPGLNSPRPGESDSKHTSV